MKQIGYSHFFGKRQATKIMQPFTKSRTLLNKAYYGDGEQINEFIISKPRSTEVLLDLQHLELLPELENGVINELSQYCRDSGEEDSYQIWNLTALL